MKLNNRNTFTGWFGLALVGFILVTLNELGLLATAAVHRDLKFISAAICLPGLFLIARYGFLICQRLEDGERERKELQEQVDTHRQTLSAGTN